jgi:hypothetical protein
LVNFCKILIPSFVSFAPFAGPLRRSPRSPRLRLRVSPSPLPPFVNFCNILFSSQCSPSLWSIFPRPAVGPSTAAQAQIQAHTNFSRTLGFHACCNRGTGCGPEHKRPARRPGSQPVHQPAIMIKSHRPQSPIPSLLTSVKSPFPASSLSRLSQAQLRRSDAPTLHPLHPLRPNRKVIENPNAHCIRSAQSGSVYFSAAQAVILTEVLW